MKPGISVLGPRATALFERYNLAAMTYANLQSNGGDLAVKQAEKFLEEIVGVDANNFSDFLNVIDMDLCNPSGERVDSWELDEVGDLRFHQENVADTHYAGETTDKKTITPKDAEVKAKLSYERVNKFLRRGQAGVSMLLAALKNKFRNEILYTSIHGDTDSTSANLTGFDGWIKQALESSLTDKTGSAWTATPDVAAICDNAILKATLIRNGQPLDLPGFGFIMSKWCKTRLMQSLRAKTSDVAFSLYFKDPKTGLDSYGGYPIYTPNYWPSDLIKMTLPKNLWLRLSNEVTGDIPLVEIDKDIVAKNHTFVLSRPIDAKIAKDAIIHVAYDTANTYYTELVP